jgi:hypothetical protein
MARMAQTAAELGIVRIVAVCDQLLARAREMIGYRCFAAAHLAHIVISDEDRCPEVVAVLLVVSTLGTATARTVCLS